MKLFLTSDAAPTVNDFSGLLDVGAMVDSVVLEGDGAFNIEARELTNDTDYAALRTRTI